MEHLNFDIHFQKHFVNHLLRDSDFLEQTIHDLKPELFSDETIQRVVRVVQNFYMDNRSAPNTLVFRKLDDWKLQNLLNEDTHKVLTSYIDDLFAMPLQNRSFLLQEFNRFLRTQMAKSTMLPFVEHVKKGEFEKAEELMRKLFTFRPSRDTDLGSRFTEDPDTRIFRRQNTDHVKTYTLIPELDVVLDGLRGGELMVWQSQRSSAGKSAALVHMARSAVFQGKKALVYVLEGTKEAWEDRLDQCIAGLTKDGLLDRSALQLHLTKMMDFGGDLWIKQFPMYRTKVSDLMKHQEMLENVHGFHPDVVIVDYADLLAPETASLRGDLHALGAEVYGNLVGWLQEKNMCGHTGLQSGRSAMEETHADQQHTGGSIAKAQIAHVIVSLNRTAEEHQKGITNLHVVKNREGAARMDISINTDFSRMQFWKRRE